MTNRKQRQRKQRRGHVDRSERVKPTPEAAQHHRAWPLQTLLVLGAKDGGLDADEFEAALEIVEAFHAFTLHLGFQSKLVEDRVFTGGYVEPTPSDRAAEQVATWLAWSLWLPRGVPPRLVAWIEDDEPIASVSVLRHACRLWLKVKSDRRREGEKIDKTPPAVLPMPVVWKSRSTSAFPAPSPPPSSARPATLSRASALAPHHRTITGRRS
jgi:hypothetical protein